MKKFIALSIACIASLLLNSCVGVREVERFSDAEKNIEIRMGEDVIAAFQNADMARLQKHLTAEGQEKFSKKEFDAECKNISARWGRIVDYRYLTRLEMAPLHQYVWAVRFQRRGSKGQEVYQEVLFATLAGKVDGESRIFLFGFK